MSKILDFRRPRLPLAQGRLPSRRAFQLVLMLGVIFGFLVPELLLAIGLRDDGALSGFWDKAPATTAIACNRPRIIDGDTLHCSGTRIRLASIDAPEMPGHCDSGRQCTPGDPYAARDYLATLTRGAVECAAVDIDGYGRTVARCSSAGQDLSCAMVAAGRAVERYGRLWC